jgi:hypothetical protein
LGSTLRFPIFVGTLTAKGAARLVDTKNRLPSQTRTFLTEFEAGLDPAIVNDHHYEFRVHLIPKTSAKTDADLALTFVRRDELSEEQQTQLEDIGRSGTVIVRERTRPVQNANLLKPSDVAARVRQRIPYKFNPSSHFARAWKKLGVRPAWGDPHPERTIEQFCVYDRAHNDYVYTERFVDHLVEKLQSPESFRELTGLPATPKQDE